MWFYYQLFRESSLREFDMSDYSTKTLTVENYGGIPCDLLSNYLSKRDPPGLS